MNEPRVLGVSDADVRKPMTFKGLASCVAGGGGSSTLDPYALVEVVQHIEKAFDCS